MIVLALFKIYFLDHNIMIDERKRKGENRIFIESILFCLVWIDIVRVMILGFREKFYSMI